MPRVGAITGYTADYKRDRRYYFGFGWGYFPSDSDRRSDAHSDGQRPAPRAEGRLV